MKINSVWNKNVIGNGKNWNRTHCCRPLIDSQFYWPWMESACRLAATPLSIIYQSIWKSGFIYSVGQKVTHPQNFLRYF